MTRELPDGLEDACLEALAHTVDGSLDQVAGCLERIIEATDHPDSAMFGAVCGWTAVATHKMDGPGYALAAAKTDTGEVVDTRDADDGSGVIQAMQFLVAFANDDKDTQLGLFFGLPEKAMPGFIFTILKLAAGALEKEPSSP